MSAPLVRPAAQNDTKIIAQIHKASFSPAWDESAIMGLMRNGATGWVASASSKDIGFALVRMAADEAELLSIAVVPDARQHGAGRALLEATCHGVHKAGASLLFLEVASDNLDACHLYEAQGFTRIGKRTRYYANGADALTYSLALG